MRPYPLLRNAIWVKKNEALLFFSTGKVRLVKLPVKSAKYAHVVDRGMGLDPGNGFDMSALQLHDMPGKTLKKATQKYAR
jgi:hypothetical protein